MFAHHHRRASAVRGIDVTPAPVMVATAVAGGATVLPTPVGTAAGDLLVAILMGVGSETWTPASGFTEIIDSDTITIATRTATGSDASNYTFTRTGSASNRCGTILRIPGGAFDAAGATATSMTAPGLTMTGGGLLLGAYFDSSNGTGFGTPAGMTPLGAISSAGSMALFVEHRGPGATGNRVSSGGDTSVLFAVKAV